MTGRDPAGAACCVRIVSASSGAVLADQLKAADRSLDELQRYASVVGDLDQLHVTVITHHGSLGAGWPLSDRLGETDYVVLVDHLLDGCHPDQSRT